LFSFPGDHELSGDYRGRAEMRDLFARLFEWFPDLHFEAHDIAASGPPWRMRLWVRYYDSAFRGGVHWGSWGTQYAQVRWGRITADYIANDTAAVARYLAEVRAGREA
jgi:ketosteroid isomerase-like protein